MTDAKATPAPNVSCGGFGVLGLIGLLCVAHQLGRIADAIVAHSGPPVTAVELQEQTR